MHFTEYDIECIRRAKHFIDSNIPSHHNIPDIATYAGLSATKLKAGFKQMFGMGIYHYQRESRLQKAKYLLEETDKSIKEITRSIGYKYVNNFSAAFEKRFGKTARRWRGELM